MYIFVYVVSCCCGSSLKLVMFPLVEIFCCRFKISGNFDI